jgi:hypothetical protein
MPNTYIQNLVFSSQASQSATILTGYENINVMIGDLYVNSSSGPVNTTATLTFYNNADMADEHIVFIAQMQLVYTALASPAVAGNSSILVSSSAGMIQYNQIQILTDGTNPTERRRVESINSGVLNLIDNLQYNHNLGSVVASLPEFGGITLEDVSNSENIYVSVSFTTAMTLTLTLEITGINISTTNAANTYLSNLTSPTAINQSLLFGTDNTFTIGALAASRPSAIYTAGFLNLGTFEDFTQIATPANPSTNHNRIYFKNDGNLYALNSSGMESQINTGGTVTSVMFADQSSTPIYTVGGSPVMTVGTLSITLNNQAINTVFAGPAVTGPAQPTFRALVSADIPTLAYANQSLSNLTGFTANGMVYASSTSAFATDSNITYNGSQVTLNVIDSYGGLKVKGRSGGEASISLQPDNVSDGAAGQWIFYTNGSQLHSSQDLAIFDSSTGAPAINISAATGFIGINQINPQYNLDVNGTGNFTGQVNVVSLYATSTINLATLTASSVVVSDGSSNLISSSVTSSSLNYLLNNEPLVPFTLIDNTSSPTIVEQWAIASYTAIQIFYSISRGVGLAECGTIYIITDGTDASIAQEGADLGSDGVEFTANVSGGNIQLLYTTTSTGTSATMHYKVQKWLA